MHQEKLYEPLFMAFIFTRLLWTKNQTEVSTVFTRLSSLSLCIITGLFLILRVLQQECILGATKTTDVKSLRNLAFLVKEKKE